MNWQGSHHLERALRPRGAAARLALALGKNQATVSRWARGTQPDPALWPAIEDALGLERGTLGEPPMSPGAQLDALERRVSVLTDGLDRLAKSVAELVAITEKIVRNMKDHEPNTRVEAIPSQSQRRRAAH